MPTKKKNKTLNNEDKKLIEEIIRVDHAGEHGATQIYRGQLAVFKENTESVSYTHLTLPTKA